MNKDVAIEEETKKSNDSIVKQIGSDETQFYNSDDCHTECPAQSTINIKDDIKRVIEYSMHKSNKCKTLHALIHVIN